MVSGMPAVSRSMIPASSSGGSSDAATDAATHRMVPAVSR